MDIAGWPHGSLSRSPVRASARSDTWGADEPGQEGPVAEEQVYTFEGAKATPAERVQPDRRRASARCSGPMGVDTQMGVR